MTQLECFRKTMNEMITEADWTQAVDADSQWNLFENIIKKAAYDSLPIRKPRKSKTRLQGSPIDFEIKTLVTAKKQKRGYIKIPRVGSAGKKLLEKALLKHEQLIEHRDFESTLRNLQKSRATYYTSQNIKLAKKNRDEMDAAVGVAPGKAIASALSKWKSNCSIDCAFDILRNNFYATPNGTK